MKHVHEQVERLKGKFVLTAPDRATALQDANAAGDRDAILRIAHSIAGTAGMFGFDDIGRQAVDLEAEVRGGGDVSGSVDALAGALRALPEG